MAKHQNSLKEELQKAQTLLNAIPTHSELPPLAKAFQDAGLTVKEASGLMEPARMFGQVCFASSKEAKRESSMLRAGRDAFLTALKRKQSAFDIYQANINAVLAVEAPKSMSEGLEGKFKRITKDGLFKHVTKLFDFNARDWILKESLSEKFASLESWERVAWVASNLAGNPPSMEQAPSTEHMSLEPAKIEKALEQKANDLMERFGLPGIRISGFPSLEKCQATLDSMEVAFEELARAAKVHEKAIGLGGWTFHANAFMDFGSGYASNDNKTICLSPDNGWRTLAHEWFHGLDMQAGLSAGLKKQIGFSEIGDASLNGDAPTFKSEPEAALALAAKRVMGAIRTKASPDLIGELATEPLEKAVERIENGLYERFYMNRVNDGTEAKAREDLRGLVRELLKGPTELKEVAKWREKNLGPKAELSKHYDAFILAEKQARLEKNKDANQSSSSALERFAKLADERLVEASGDSGFHGYSNSSLEMAARGFEGNCFLDTADKTRLYLVDGRDNSMYWPVGAERGAHVSAYEDFIGKALSVMAAAGDLPKEANLPRPMAPPLLSSDNISNKLAHRRKGLLNTRSDIMPSIRR